MGAQQGIYSLTSATTSKTFTSFVADINLKTTVPTSGAAQGRGCRRIRINTAGGGAISVKYGDNSTDTITGLLDGDQLDVIAEHVLSSGTTVTSITVFW